MAYIHREAHALIDGSSAVTAPQCRSYINTGIPSRVVLGKNHTAIGVLPPSPWRDDGGVSSAKSAQEASKRIIRRR